MTINFHNQLKEIEKKENRNNMLIEKIQFQYEWTFLSLWIKKYLRNCLRQIDLMVINKRIAIDLRFLITFPLSSFL